MQLKQNGIFEKKLNNFRQFYKTQSDQKWKYINYNFKLLKRSWRALQEYNKAGKQSIATTHDDDYNSSKTTKKYIIAAKTKSNFN